MKRLALILASGALVLGAGAAQAQTVIVAPGDTEVVQTAPYETMYAPGPMEIAGTSQDLNPGGGYGVTSTEGGAAGSVLSGGTTLPASQFQPDLQTGRAAVAGAPPLMYGESEEDY